MGDEKAGIKKILTSLARDRFPTQRFADLDSADQKKWFKAVLQEVDEHGLDAFSVKRLAESQQLSVGSLYNLFGSKEKLLEWTAVVVSVAMQRHASSGTDDLLRVPFREALVELWAPSAEKPTHWNRWQRFADEVAAHGDADLKKLVWEPLLQTERDVIRLLLANGIENGEVAADIDFEETALLIASLKPDRTGDTADTLSRKTAEKWVETILEGIAPTEDD
jgi:AcrR family transcriptional regulator